MADKDFTVKNGLQVNGGTWVVNSTAFFYSGTQFINATAFAGQSNTALTANNSTNLGGYTWSAPPVLGTGTANGASFTYTTVSGQVNTATVYASSSANVASAVLANSSGVYTSGVVNASAIYTGTVLVANTTGVQAFPVGTVMLFVQTTAPVGWVKSITHDNKALRVVSGAAGSGGSVAFTSAFASRSFSGSTSSVTVTGSVGATTLTINQIPWHQHYSVKSGATSSGNQGIKESANYSTNNNYDLSISASEADMALTSGAGGSGAHSHSFSGGAHTHTFSSSIDMTVQYVDVIIATKQ